MTIHVPRRLAQANLSTTATTSSTPSQQLCSTIHPGCPMLCKCSILRNDKARFHTSRQLRSQPPDHYATLGLTPSASAGEVKKHFYQLSKTHHPDHNPQNQEAASKKFMEISNAYNVLGNPTARDEYDRKIVRKESGAAASYASSPSSAGGRKASGLSRRKTQFRGPPPSYYRSGAWTQDGPRRTNQGPAAEGASWPHSQQQQSYQQHQQHQTRSTGARGGSETGTGSGPGAWPFQTDPNDVPHFDRDEHYRTTSSVEEQLRSGRKKRRSRYASVEETDPADYSPGDALGRFLMVGAVLSVGVGLPLMFFSGTA